ncbi:MAG: type I methionyl aminopeptidase [Nitrospirae bacterium]|nr:type I methionyl aminopeptidase [Candidatus Troglogloeales bacterium]MBI3598874.1 type I methionyl aminopeptidase [Candidatus Troglogloeales bacterium]
MIILKSKEEIARIAHASKIVAEVLQVLKKNVKAGVTTKELDRLAEEQIKKRGGVPAFKRYRDFPATLCVSINDQVVHGIPSKRVIKDGDIVGLDLGVIFDGFCGDAALTVAVGDVPPATLLLLRVTEASLYAGIQEARMGARLSNISHAIQTCAEAAGFSLVTEFVGHGIGRDLHEDPQVPNFGPPGQGPRLRDGMVLAIEPMVNMGKSEVRILEDKWTAVTCDHSLSAHFEHTVSITKGGPVILSCI